VQSTAGEQGEHDQNVFEVTVATLDIVGFGPTPDAAHRVQMWFDRTDVIGTRTVRGVRLEDGVGLDG